ncbi:MAG: hypothetical protein ACJA1L_003654 [Paracoccaceae bacterium]|jgi:hypothetical protein
MGTPLTRRAFTLALGAAVMAPYALRAAGPELKLRDLYAKDLSFSDAALAADGGRITIRGFMAPPLRAQSAFFVLTKRPMATCPFCETSADWPDDIIAVYAKRVVDVAPFNVPLAVNGVLRLSDHIDPDTGFFSRLRLTDAIYDRV